MGSCCGQLLNQLAHAQAHRIKIIDYSLHIVENREKVALQFCQLRIAVNIHFYINKSFALRIVDIGFVAGGQPRIVITHHPDRITMQSKDI